MSARQTKKRKGRSTVNNRERTVTTFTQDPNTSFLVPLPSEEPPANFSFAMPYQNYPQQQFYQPVLPPGKNDLEILENLKSIIKDGQHELYRAVPQPAALASLYMGNLPQQPQEEYLFDNANDLDTPQSLNNTNTSLSGPDTSPIEISPETPTVPEPSVQPSVQPEPAEMTTQGPPDDATTDAAPMDNAVSNQATPLDAAKDDQPTQPATDNAWERRTLDDKNVGHDDRDTNPPANRALAYDNRPKNGAVTDGHHSPADRRLQDRDRARDHWDRDRDRHDSTRDFRDRNRERDVRDRRPEFIGRTYGRSHAPRPPPELRHYEPSYGDDFVPSSRRYDPDDRRGGPRNASFDDRSKHPPFDDRRPAFDDRRPPPPSADDERRLPLDDRPIRRLPGSDNRALPPTSEDRTRPGPEPIPLARTEDDRSVPAPSLSVDDRPRANVPLEERLSQHAPPPSLQDRLSQPAPVVVPARADIAPAPSLEERLSSGPVPRAYQRSASAARDDLRPPLPKDDPRDHDRINDFRTNRDFSRERPIASSYRPDMDRALGEGGDRDRRDRDVVAIDTTAARYGDVLGRVGPPPPRRYSPPPAFDRDRERERGRGYYPPRSPPPFRGEGVYDPEVDRRYATDREREIYEQRRRDWYVPGDDDKRGLPPTSASWRPHDRLPFADRDRERFDRERERDRDFRERDRERDRELSGLMPLPPTPLPPPPARGHWDDRDRRMGIQVSAPPSRIDPTVVGPGRSLSARLTDPYPPPGGDGRAYPPPRDFDRGRYGGPPVDDHAHSHGHVPPAFSRIRNRSPSPPRRVPGVAEDLRPPVKRLREDSNAGYSGGPVYSDSRRVGVPVGVGGAGEYTPGPPPSSAATTTATGMSTVGGPAARSAGTRSPPPPASAPLPSTSGSFYDRDRDRERDREREYVRGEYGMGYERDDRGRRSPPMLGPRMGGYGRSVVGDRRYVPPPPPRTG